MNVQDVNEYEIREMNEEQSESKWTTDQKYMNNRREIKPTTDQEINDQPRSENVNKNHFWILFKSKQKKMTRSRFRTAHTEDKRNYFIIVIK